jgi:hypothetical protein
MNFIPIPPAESFYAPIILRVILEEIDNDIEKLFLVK